MSPHRAVCVQVAAWTLRQPWCGIAGVEIAIHKGFADVLAVSDPRRLPVNPEHTTQSKAETKAARAAYRRGEVHTPVVPALLRRRNSEPEPRVVVVECKRTRSDLLGDLRAKKMLRYEASATHCYLALTDEVLSTFPKVPSALKSRLVELGLPRTWGILRVNINQPGWTGVSALRTARRLQPTTPHAVYGTAWDIACSLSWKAVNG